MCTQPAVVMVVTNMKYDLHRIHCIGQHCLAGIILFLYCTCTMYITLDNVNSAMLWLLSTEYVHLQYIALGSAVLHYTSTEYQYIALGSTVHCTCTLHLTRCSLRFRSFPQNRIYFSGTVPLVRYIVFLQTHNVIF